MKSYFNASFFRGNRQKLRQLCQTELIVVTANGLLQRSGDTTFPFRQDSNFWYLTGIDEPDIVLVMDKSREYLIVPERDTHRLVFDGAVDMQVLRKKSGIDDIQTAIPGWKHLDVSLASATQAATLLSGGAYAASYGLYVNPARAALLERLKKTNPDLDFVDIRKQLAAMRVVKQKPELQALQAAITVTAATLRELSASEQWPGYTHEHQIEAAVTQGFRARGASGHAYSPIVASGKHACTLHYVANNGKLQPDDLILLDVGAEVQNYAADITRVYTRSTPTARQQVIHQAVIKTQEFALQQLQPGVMLKSYEQSVEQYIGEQLRELGLINEIEHAAIRKYCSHATSHFLGLDVHDVGDYQSPLEPGMVLTVEPGIYIPEEGIGIRIEDDVLITEEGNKVLSAELPRDLL